MSKLADDTAFLRAMVNFCWSRVALDLIFHVGDPSSVAPESPFLCKFKVVPNLSQPFYELNCF